MSPFSVLIIMYCLCDLYLQFSSKPQKRSINSYSFIHSFIIACLNCTLNSQSLSPRCQLLYRQLASQCQWLVFSLKSRVPCQKKNCDVFSSQSQLLVCELISMFQRGNCSFWLLTSVPPGSWKTSWSRKTSKLLVLPKRDQRCFLLLPCKSSENWRRQITQITLNRFKGSMPVVLVSEESRLLKNECDLWPICQVLSWSKFGISVLAQDQ